jgi:predicted DNA-binding transcriptional regulator AlpA
VTTPARHDVIAAAELVGKSPSWMYKKGAAGEIPRTKIGHHVSWTDEQITQIIRDGAQEPKQAKAREQRQPEQKRKTQPAKAEPQPKQESKPTTGKAANVPVADFSVSRLYRQGTA